MFNKMGLYLTAIAVAVVLFSPTAFAQASLRGHITDPLGAPVKNANVTLQQGDREAGAVKSDEAGAFSFTSVDTGRYRVKVDAAGFAPYLGPDVFVAASGAAPLEVVLRVGALKESVVVSATGTQIPVAQVGASVSLIDHEDIQAQNKLDTLENLRQIPGAQIVQAGQRGSQTSFFIRGGESTFNKVLVDGVPVNAIGGGFDFSQLSTVGIESVEVLQGPNSVLYGADSLAGVVNISTERGTSALPELKFSADGGNFGTYNRNVSLGGAFHNFDYFSQLGRYDTQGNLPDNFFHNQTFAGNFGWSPDSKTNLRATVRKTWSDLGSPNAIYLFGLADDSAQKDQNTYVSGTAQHQTTTRWHNLLRFAYSEANSLYTNPSPTGTPFDPFGFGANYLGNLVTLRGANGYSVTGQGILDFGGAYPSISPIYEARRSAYAQTDYNFFRDWTGTFGFRYEHEDGSGITRDNYGYFTEAHGHVGRRLYLTAGVGVENNAVFGYAASPRVSAAYYLRRPSSSAFFAETKLKFNFGKGIKETGTAQEASQLYSLLTPQQRTQFSVDPLGPERSRAFDFGVEQGLWNGRARLDVTLFQNRFYNLITFLNQPELVSLGVNPAAANLAQFGAYLNATSTSAKGAEIKIISEIGHGLRWQASYTYLDAVVTKAFGGSADGTSFPNIPIGAFAPLQGARPFRRAPHTGTLALYYTHRKLTTSLTGYMVSRSDDSTFLSDGFFGNSLLLPNRNLLNSYQKFDLSGRYALKRYVSVYTAIENLLDQHYQSAYGYPALPFTIRAGLTFTIGGEDWHK